MIISNIYVHRLSITGMLFLSTIPYIFASKPASPENSWSSKLTPRIFKKKTTLVIPTQEYTVPVDGTIDISHIEGSIKIKSWEQDKVLIDATKEGTQEELSSTIIQANQKDKTLSLRTSVAEGTDAASVKYRLMIPQKSNLKIHTSTKGDIKVKQVQGVIQIVTEQGSIEIYDATNTLRAQSNNGSLKIKQKTLVPPSSLLLETLKGDVHLYVPKKVHADIHAKTLNGIITSKQQVTLNPQTLILTKESWNNMRKEVRGILGNGGAPIIIDVSKGNIILDEY